MPVDSQLNRRVAARRRREEPSTEKKDRRWRRIFLYLDAMDYSVYYNREENHSDSFPEHIENAIAECRDFILILSEGCLRQLQENHKIDWVRKELLLAKKGNKHIIPVLLPGVHMPKDMDDMPEELRFLPNLNALRLPEPEEYKKAPIENLFGLIKAKQEKNDVYRSIFNGSPDRDINRFFSETAVKAEQGDISAKYALAVLYYYGFADGDGGSKRQLSKAYKLLYELSDTPVRADGEDCDLPLYADSLIGEMYYNGTVPQEGQSFEKAMEYHARAAEKSAFSARECAYLKTLGVFGSQSPEEIAQTYNKAIDAGDKVAILGLAQYYKLQGRFHEAAQLYKKASKVFPEAELELGKLYAKGLLSQPPEPDYYKAAFYYQHAISTGKCDAKVYYELGRLYLTPFGDFPKDDALAQQLFTEAAARGSFKAAFKLGCMYEYGTVEKDPQKAIRYFTVAAQAGLPLAAYHLAVLYRQPEVCNYHKAFTYAKIAAERGVPEGELLYGVMLLFGTGCKADADEAMRYLRTAYSHGVYQASVFLNAFDGVNDKD